MSLQRLPGRTLPPGLHTPAAPDLLPGPSGGREYHPPRGGWTVVALNRRTSIPSFPAGTGSAWTPVGRAKAQRGCGGGLWGLVKGGAGMTRERAAVRPDRTATFSRLPRMPVQGDWRGRSRHRGGTQATARIRGILDAAERLQNAMMSADPLEDFGSLGVGSPLSRLGDRHPCVLRGDPPDRGGPSQGKQVSAIRAAIFRTCPKDRGPSSWTMMARIRPPFHRGGDGSMCQGAQAAAEITDDLHLRLPCSAACRRRRPGTASPGLPQL